MGMIMTRIINQKPAKRAATTARTAYYASRKERCTIATLFWDIFHWIFSVIYAVFCLAITCGLPVVGIYFLIKWIFF